MAHTDNGEDSPRDPNSAIPGTVWWLRWLLGDGADSLTAIARDNRSDWRVRAALVAEALAKALHGEPASHPRAEASYLGVRHRLALPSSPTRRRAVWPVWILSAAAGLCLAIVGYLSVRTSSRASGVARTYATGIGERAIVRLADGSRVILEPATTLWVPAAFNGRTRTITLSGQARFIVPSSAGVPFLVKSGAVTTRVLGTVFEVSHYPNGDVGRVLVVSGKVSTTTHGEPVILTAGQLGRFSDSVVTMSPTQDTTLSYADWVNGTLVFHDAPVSAVLAAVQRWYGYDVRVADSSLVTEAVSVTLTGARDEVIKRLEHLLGMSATFSDSVITLHPKAGLPVTRSRYPQPVASPERGR